MFEIDANNLPVVRTRQALLVLDLQNDIVSDGSPLQVDTPLDFVPTILNLVSYFRTSGPVVWIRSAFVSSRPVNEPQGESEKVITDRELLGKHRRFTYNDGYRRGRSRPSSVGSSKTPEGRGSQVEDHNPLEVDDDEDNDPISEAFLTVEPGDTPQIVLQNSTGSNLAEVVLESVDKTRDLFFEKSHYSAFKDGKLVQILRSQFVTEIYICGALSNISVFATAMDAARHGYAITIITDCLGYRSKARHDEAMNQLTQFTGCDMIDSQDLIGHFQRKANAKRTPTPSRNARPRPRPRPKDSSLENLMSDLNIATANCTDDWQFREPNSVTGSSKVAESQREEQETFGKETQKKERVSAKVKVRRRDPEIVPSNVATTSKSTERKGKQQCKHIEMFGLLYSLTPKVLEYAFANNSTCLYRSSCSSERCSTCNFWKSVFRRTYLEQQPHGSYLTPIPFVRKFSDAVNPCSFLI